MSRGHLKVLILLCLMLLQPCVGRARQSSEATINYGVVKRESVRAKGSNTLATSVGKRDVNFSKRIKVSLSTLAPSAIIGSKYRPSKSKSLAKDQEKTRNPVWSIALEHTSSPEVTSYYLGRVSSSVNEAYHSLTMSTAMPSIQHGPASVELMSHHTSRPLSQQRVFPSVPPIESFLVHTQLAASSPTAAKIFRNTIPPTSLSVTQPLQDELPATTRTKGNINFRKSPGKEYSNFERHLPATSNVHSVKLSVQAASKVALVAQVTPGPSVNQSVNQSVNHTLLLKMSAHMTLVKLTSLPSLVSSIQATSSNEESSESVAVQLTSKALTLAHVTSAQVASSKMNSANVYSSSGARITDSPPQGMPTSEPSSVDTSEIASDRGRFTGDLADPANLLKSPQIETPISRNDVVRPSPSTPANPSTIPRKTAPNAHFTEAKLESASVQTTSLPSMRHDKSTSLHRDTLFMDSPSLPSGLPPSAVPRNSICIDVSSSFVSSSFVSSSFVSSASSSVDVDTLVESRLRSTFEASTYSDLSITNHVDSGLNPTATSSTLKAHTPSQHSSTIVPKKFAKHDSSLLTCNLTAFHLGQAMRTRLAPEMAHINGSLTSAKFSDQCFPAACSPICAAQLRCVFAFAPQLHSNRSFQVVCGEVNSTFSMKVISLKGNSTRECGCVFRHASSTSYGSQKSCLGGLHCSSNGAPVLPRVLHLISAASLSSLSLLVTRRHRNKQVFSSIANAVSVASLLSTFLPCSLQIAGSSLEPSRFRCVSFAVAPFYSVNVWLLSLLSISILVFFKSKEVGNNAGRFLIRKAAYLKLVIAIVSALLCIIIANLSFSPCSSEASRPISDGLLIFFYTCAILVTLVVIALQVKAFFRHQVWIMNKVGPGDAQLKMCEVPSAIFQAGLQSNFMHISDIKASLFTSAALLALLLLFWLPFLWAASKNVLSSTSVEDGFKANAELFGYALASAAPAAIILVCNWMKRRSTSVKGFEPDPLIYAANGAGEDVNGEAKTINNVTPM